MDARADPRDSTYQLHFESLRDASRALSFPCDAEGHVPIDTLSERARRDYLYARAVIGGEFARPVIKLALRL